MSGNNYKILRINEQESTITVLLCSNGHKLQQDIEVDDFSDTQGIKKLIYGHLGKLESDLASVKKEVEVAPELHELAESDDPVSVTDSDISDNPLPEPENETPATTDEDNPTPDGE